MYHTTFCFRLNRCHCKLVNVSSPVFACAECGVVWLQDGRGRWEPRRVPGGGGGRVFPAGRAASAVRVGRVSPPIHRLPAALKAISGSVFLHSQLVHALWRAPRMFWNSAIACAHRSIIGSTAIHHGAAMHSDEACRLCIHFVTCAGRNPVIVVVVLAKHKIPAVGIVGLKFWGFVDCQASRAQHGACGVGSGERRPRGGGRGPRQPGVMPSHVLRHARFVIHRMQQHMAWHDTCDVICHALQRHYFCS